jgi:glycosyltransferase involved in cell wall biosynthesis
MSASCRVSVLMPVRNAEDTVGRAIRSVLEQSFGDFELVVVENGSEDATRQVVVDLAREDFRVRVHCLPEPDLVAALNHGIEVARAPLIARMDADDICDKRRLELQVRWLELRSETGLVSCLVRHVGDSGAQAGYAAYVRWINSLVTHEQISLGRFVESPLAHPSVMFRREIAGALGAWRRGNFPEDYDLWLRWLEGGVRMEKVPEVLLDWGDPPGRLSRTDARYAPRAFFQCKAAYLCRWLERVPAGNRTLLFWGAGRETRRRIRSLTSLGVRHRAWIDIDPRKWGKRIDGLPVWPPDRLPTAAECFVVSWVSSRGAREEIAGHLQAHGFAEGRDFILAG